MSKLVQACPPVPGGNRAPREPSRGASICPARETSRTAKSAGCAQQAGRILHDRPEAREVGALICLAHDEPDRRVAIAQPPDGCAALGSSGRTRLSRRGRLTVRVGFVAESKDLASPSGFRGRTLRCWASKKPFVQAAAAADFLDCATTPSGSSPTTARCSLPWLDAARHARERTRPYRTASRRPYHSGPMVLQAQNPSRKIAFLSSKAPRPPRLPVPRQLRRRPCRRSRARSGKPGTALP